MSPNGGAAKSGLNRSILDAGWGVFLNVLHAKAESAGKVVVEVDPRNTSRRCAECGHTAHADVNAARTILRAGMARHAAAAA